MGTDDLSTLVYRVTPLPSTLRDFVFDFGSLPESEEAEYIHQMVRKMLKIPILSISAGIVSIFGNYLPWIFIIYSDNEADSHYIQEMEFKIIAYLISISQTFCRKSEGDQSAVSLRDAKRAIHFMNFFLNVKSKASDKALRIQAVVLGLAFVYFYRQSKGENRYPFLVWENDRQGEVESERVEGA